MKRFKKTLTIAFMLVATLAILGSCQKIGFLFGTNVTSAASIFNDKAKVVWSWNKVPGVTAYEYQILIDDEEFDKESGWDRVDPELLKDRKITLADLIGEANIKDGTYTLYLRGIAADGERTDESSFSVTLDTTPPATPVVSGPEYTSNARPTWTWEAVDGAVLYKVGFTKNGPWEDAPNNFYTPKKALNDGARKVYVYAIDAAGNESKISEPVETVIDTETYKAPIVVHETDGVEGKDGAIITRNRRPFWDFYVDRLGRDEYDEDDNLELSEVLYVRARLMRYQLNSQADGGWTVIPINGVGRQSFQPSEDLPSGLNTLYVQVAKVDNDGIPNWSKSGSAAYLIDASKPHPPRIYGKNSVRSGDNEGRLDWIVKLSDDIVDLRYVIATSYEGNEADIDWEKYKAEGQEETDYWPLDEALDENNNIPKKGFFPGLSQGDFILLVQARDSKGVRSDVVSFTTNVGEPVKAGRPDITLRTTSPTNNPNVRWTWAAVNNATYYRYQLDGTSGEWTIVPSSKREYIAEYSDFAIAHGKHTLYVQSTLDTDVISATWSESGTSEVELILNAPGKPFILIGEDVTANRAPTWGWNGVSGAVEYRVRLGHVDGVTKEYDQGTPAWMYITSTSFTTLKELELDANVSENNYYKFEVQAIDQVGNLSLVSEKITKIEPARPGVPVFTQQPSLSFGRTSETKPTWSWSHPERDTFRYSLDGGTTWINGTNGSKATTYTASTLAEGEHKFRVQAFDGLLWSNSAAQDIVVDITGPETPIFTNVAEYVNQNGEELTVSSKPTWNWAPVDSGDVAGYRYRINGKAWEDSDDRTYTSADDVADGKYLLELQAKDYVGNWSASASYVIQVLTAAPDTPIIDGPTSIVKGDELEWTWDLCGAASKVHFSMRPGIFNGNVAGLLNGQQTCIENEHGSIDWDESKLSHSAGDTTALSGNYTIAVQAFNILGTPSRIATFTTTISAVPVPLVVAETKSPTNNTSPKWSWIEIPGVQKYRYKVNEGSWTEVAASVKSFTASNLGEGNNTLYVQAAMTTNPAEANWSASGSSTIVIDTTPPAKPEVLGNATTNATPITWTWVPASGSPVGYRYRAGHVNSSMNYDQGTPVWIESTDLSFTTPEYNISGEDENNYYKFEIQAKDAAGNLSEKVTFITQVVTDLPAAPTFTTRPTLVDGKTNSSSPKWVWEHEDSEIDTFRYSLNNGVTWINGRAGSSDTTYTASGLTEKNYTFIVQAFNGVKWSNSATFNFAVDLTGPLAPAVTSTAAITKNTRPTWTWTPADSRDASAYRYGLVEGTWTIVASTTREYRPASALSDGVYTLYVQTQDTVGNWGDTGSFTIEVLTAAPATPVISGPASVTKGANAEWTWTAPARTAVVRFGVLTTTFAVDPTADLSTLIDCVEISNRNIDWPSTKLSHTVSSSGQSGRFTIYVQVLNELGTWSNSASFVTNVDPIDVPVVTALTASPTTNTSPKWSWDDVAGAKYYRYQLNRETGAWTQVPASVTNFDASGLFEGVQTLNVQATIVDNPKAGDWSASGKASVTIDLTPPARPTISGDATTNKVPIVWTWTAPSGNPVEYRYRVGHANSSGVFDQGTPAAVVTSNLSYTSPAYTIDPNEENNYYRFELEARDEAGNWSFASHFITQIVAGVPNSPVFTTSPTLVNGKTNNASPTWIWEYDGELSAHAYRYSMNGGATWLNGEAGSMVTIYSASNLNEGSYIFAVQVQEEAAGKWSPSRNFQFTVDKTGPIAPSVTSAAAMTNIAKPTWTWTPYDENDVDGYRYRINEGAWNEVDKTVLSYKPSSDLADNTYKLDVQAKDAVGNWGASGTFTVQIVTTVPDKPIVSGPAQVDKGDEITWSWTLGSGVAFVRFGVVNGAFTGDKSEDLTTQILCVARSAGNFDWPISKLSHAISSSGYVGNKTIIVQTVNVFGSWSEAVTFTTAVNDVAAPVVSKVTASPTNLTNPQWSWTEVTGAYFYRYQLNSEAGNWITVSAATKSYTASGLTEGTHTLYVQASLQVSPDDGDWSDSGSDSIVIDLTPPAAPSVSGQATTNSRKPSWTWVAPSGGPVAYRYRLGHASTAGAFDQGTPSWSSESTVLSFTPADNLTVDPVDNDNNYYRFEVQARDAVGNWSTSGYFVTQIIPVGADAPTITESPSLTSGRTSNNTPKFTWTHDSSTIFRYSTDNGTSWRNGTNGSAVTTWTSGTGLADGAYVFAVQAYDGVLWSASSTFAFTIDTTGPAAPAVTSAYAVTTNTKPTWSWTPVDASDIAGYRHRINNGTWTEVASSVTSWAPATALADGSYKVDVQGKDAVGNWGESGFFTVDVLTTAPSKPTVYGQVEVIKGAQISWNWIVGGDAVSVRFGVVDGAFAGDDTADLTTQISCVAESGFNYDWPATKLTHSISSSGYTGIKTIVVQVLNSLGIWSEAATFTTTVNAILVPSVTTITLSPTNNANPEWTWTAVPNAKKYRYQLDRETGTWTVVDSSVRNFVASALAEGTRTLYVQATMQDNPTSGDWSSSGSAAIVIDLTPPGAPVVSGDVIADNRRPVWTWTEPSGNPIGYRVRIGHADSTGQYDEGTPAWLDETSQTQYQPMDRLDIDTSDYTKNFYRIEVQARDLVGNWSVSGSFVTQIIPGPTPPPIIIQMPKIRTSENRPTWMWYHEDYNIFRYSIDGGTTWANGENGSAATEWTSARLADGPYVFAVQVYDGIDWSVSATQSFIVDTTGPIAPVVSDLGGTGNKRPTWTWTHNDPLDVEKFRYSFDSTTWTEVAKTVMSYTPDSDLPFGNYTLYVQAADDLGNWGDAGQGSANIAQALNPPTVTGEPLCAPIVNGTTRRPTWSWTELTGATGYRYRINNAANWTEVGSTITSFTTSINLNGLQVFEVQAKNAANVWSESGTFETLVDFVAPEAPTVTTTGSPTTGNRKPTWIWSHSNPSDVAKYRYQLNGSDEGAWTEVDPTEISFRPDFLLGLIPNTLYVQAQDANGNWSSSGDFTITIIITFPDQIDINSVSKGVFSKAVRIEWQEDTSADSYEIFRISEEEFGGNFHEGTSIATVSGEYTFYYDEDVEDGKNYYYRIRGTSEVAGNGPKTTFNSSALREKSRGYLLNSPSAISTPIALDNTVTVGWTSVPGITKYELYRVGPFNAAQTQAQLAAASWTSLGEITGNSKFEPASVFTGALNKYFYYKVKSINTTARSSSTYSAEFAGSNAPSGTLEEFTITDGFIREFYFLPLPSSIDSWFTVSDNDPSCPGKIKLTINIAADYRQHISNFDFIIERKYRWGGGYQGHNATKSDKSSHTSLTNPNPLTTPMEKTIRLEYDTRGSAISGSSKVVYDTLYDTDANGNKLIAIRTATGTPMFYERTQTQINQDPTYFEVIVDPDGTPAEHEWHYLKWDWVVRKTGATSAANAGNFDINLMTRADYTLKMIYAGDESISVSTGVKYGWPALTAREFSNMIMFFRDVAFHGIILSYADEQTELGVNTPTGNITDNGWISGQICAHDNKLELIGLQVKTNIFTRNGVGTDPNALYNFPGVGINVQWTPMYMVLGGDPGHSLKNQVVKIVTPKWSGEAKLDGSLYGGTYYHGVHTNFKIYVTHTPNYTGGIVSSYMPSGYEHQGGYSMPHEYLNNGFGWGRADGNNANNYYDRFTSVNWRPYKSGRVYPGF